jgi:hypothetical protein
MRLAGGTIAYKTKFQPTLAGSSTEAEFMAAYDAGKMILFFRSILWDLGIPQEAAMLLYKESNTCMAHKNQRLGRDTLTSSTSHYAIGWNVI